MKKALIGLLAAGTLVGCGGNTYTITGKLDPGITDSVFLMQTNPENPTIASAAVAADGTFKIKGTIDQPDLAILTNRHRQGIGFIFLEPGKIDVKTADLGQFQVGGTRSNEIFQPINDSLGMLQGQFLVAMQENDMEKFDSLNQVANGIMRRALDNNSDNLVGVYFFGNLYNEMEPQEAREILNKFPEQMQKTQILTAIAESAKTSGTSKATGLLPRFFLSFKLIGMLPMLPILVILLTLLRVTQYFIGFIDFLKLVLRTWVIRVQVRMILPGQLTKSLLYIILRSTFVNSKNLIIIYISHVL